MPKPLTITYDVWPNPEAVAQAAARLFSSAVQQAADSRGVARVAISGGTTPKRVFQLLADPRPALPHRDPVGQIAPLLG